MYAEIRQAVVAASNAQIMATSIAVTLLLGLQCISARKSSTPDAWGIRDLLVSAGLAPPSGTVLFDGAGAAVAVGFPKIPAWVTAVSSNAFLCWYLTSIMMELIPTVSHSWVGFIVERRSGSVHYRQATVTLLAQGNSILSTLSLWCPQPACVAMLAPMDPSLSSVWARAGVFLRGPWWQNLQTDLCIDWRLLVKTGHQQVALPKQQSMDDQP
ncbi:hypothetical protein IFR04_002453 [Cadophora malorum]|uniref:Uncharacterized protein n=1 Tax=Cadophora malorum TaxID=108018 RepID=A0A8H7WGJ5_9HELO|nr:hypothetical protein IFR04_002453 [Cadophora malorum]